MLRRYILSIHFPLTREDEARDTIARYVDLSIHFPLTREDIFDTASQRSLRLSIHFPLTREDFTPIPKPEESGTLSIHFPLTREDVPFEAESSSRDIEQSTSLSRGKTFQRQNQGGGMTFQSTSLSRGKTSRRQSRNRPSHLSIHFPLTREDCNGFNTLGSQMAFQSTSLSRGKTSSCF